MAHPDLPGQPYDAAESQVPHLRAAGWQVAEAEPETSEDQAELADVAELENEEE